jgi:hypothetical protein
MGHTERGMAPLRIDDRQGDGYGGHMAHTNCDIRKASTRDEYWCVNTAELNDSRRAIETNRSNDSV